MIWGIKKYLLFVLLICLTTSHLYGQDQRIADSLKPIYQADTLVGIDKLELLRDLSFHEGKDLKKAEGYSQELIEYAAASDHEDSQTYLYRGYRNKGYALEAQGKMYEALKSYFDAHRAAKKVGYLEGEALTTWTIAGIISGLGDNYIAQDYYQQSISDWEKLGDSLYLCMALFNSGDALLNSNELDKAKVNLTRAQDILNDLKKKNDPEVVDQLNLIETYIQGDLGIYYAETGDSNAGQRLLKSAISRLEPIMDYEGISEFQLALSEILISEGQFDEASILVNSSLEHATKQQRKKIIGKANGLLADLAEFEGDTEKALNHRNISNSINEELQQMRQQSRQHIYSLAQQQFDSENEILRGEQKIDRQRTMIILTAAVLLLLALLAVGLFGRYRYIRNTNRIISEEKKRSDGLLLNILPKDTAEELISHGHVKAKKYNSVTVMFTDFLGFTRYADDLPPEELVKAVDYYFSRFDQIIERHGLEKIKTVGDAYLCAGGLPDPSIDHPERIIRAAFDIIDLVKKAKYDENDLTRFDVRIGISTGPVVAGVVGSMKFAYDIWGDTVNCASRMETNSEPMRINVSQYTFELVKDKFDFTPRGEIEVKNKGKMRMYFAEPPESKDSKRAFQGDASLIV